MANKVVESLWRWTEQGRLPVVIDASCTLGLVHEEWRMPGRGERRAASADRRSSTRSSGRATSCSRGCTSSQGARGRGPLHLRAGTSHDRAPGRGRRGAGRRRDAPRRRHCCGFAGDRGMLHPELTASATRNRRRRSPAGTSTPTCARTGPARSAWSGPSVVRTSTWSSSSSSSPATLIEAQADSGTQRGGLGHGVREPLRGDQAVAVAISSATSTQSVRSSSWTPTHPFVPT